LGSSCVCCTILIVFSFSYYERRSHHKNVVKKDREEIFIMCLHIYTHPHIEITILCEYVCVRFPIILQTLHLIEHSIGEWRTEVTITISLSPTFSLLTMIALHKSYIIEWKMMMIIIIILILIVRVSPFFKVEGIFARLYWYIHADMNSNS
jgi:hypothetical protein